MTEPDLRDSIDDTRPGRVELTLPLARQALLRAFETQRHMVEIVRWWAPDHPAIAKHEALERWLKQAGVLP